MLAACMLFLLMLKISAGAVLVPVEQAKIEGKQHDFQGNTRVTNLTRRYFDYLVNASAIRSPRNSMSGESSFNLSVIGTDNAHDLMFTDLTPLKLLKIKRQIDKKGEFRYTVELLSDEELNCGLEADAVDGKIHVASSGSFLTLAEAVKYAAQQSTARAGPQYLSFFPQAEDAKSEVFIDLYQKFFENDARGLTLATQLIKELVRRYGRSGLHLDGHSRGALTIGNALKSLSLENNQYALASNTSINLFGSPYNVAAMADMLGTLAGNSSTAVLRHQTHAGDLVGRLIGGNPATGGVIPPQSSYWRELLNNLIGNDTPHGSYCVSKCLTTIYWQEDTPRLSQVLPALAEQS